LDIEYLNVNLMGGFEWLARVWSDGGVATWRYAMTPST
jgi:hypothetical protein